MTSKLKPSLYGDDCFLSGCMITIVICYLKRLFLIEFALNNSNKEKKLWVVSNLT